MLWTEFVLLAVFGLVGVAADRIGRRQIFAIGLVFMGLSYVLHAYAGELWQLFGARVAYAIGIGAATGMLATILAGLSAGNLARTGGWRSAVALTGLGVVLIKLMFGDGARVVVESLGAPARGKFGADRGACSLSRAVAFVSAAVAAWGLQPGTADHP